MVIDTTTQDHETARPDPFFALWQHGEISAHEALRVLCADLRLLDETLSAIAAEHDALRAQIGQIVGQLGGTTSLPGIGRLELPVATVMVSYERRQLDALIIALTTEQPGIAAQLAACRKETTRSGGWRITPEKPGR
jgi:hypothetical protein